MKASEAAKYLKNCDPNLDVVVLNRDEYTQLIKIKQKYLRIKSIIFSEVKAK